MLIARRGPAQSTWLHNEAIRQQAFGYRSPDTVFPVATFLRDLSQGAALTVAPARPQELIQQLRERHCAVGDLFSLVKILTLEVRKAVSDIV